MNDELKSMKDNDIWDLNRLVIHGCLKPSEIRKVMSKNIRHVLPQRDSLKERTLTIKRLSSRFS